MSTLTLFIPGLLTPARDIPVTDQPAFPAIQYLLAHGHREKLPVTGFCRILSTLFMLDSTSVMEPPAAPVTWCIDEDCDTDGIWMRGDPVHLLADVNKMILQDESVFNLDQHDALVLAADIRESFTQRGMELYTPTTTRWYIELDKLPDIKTTPIHEVAGNDIRPFLPGGKEQLFWKQLLNEVQMALNSSPVNEKRIRQGELPINSLWFWGCGRLPAKPAVPWSKIYADDVMTKGLARLSGRAFYDLPETIDEIFRDLSDSDNILVVISFGYYHTQYQNHRGWMDYAGYLEELWFKGILNALKQKKITSLNVFNEFYKISISKSSFLKFWKGKFRFEAQLMQRETKVIPFTGIMNTAP